MTSRRRFVRRTQRTNDLSASRRNLRRLASWLRVQPSKLVKLFPKKTFETSSSAVVVHGTEPSNVRVRTNVGRQQLPACVAAVPSFLRAFAVCVPSSARAPIPRDPFAARRQTQRPTRRPLRSASTRPPPHFALYARLEPASQPQRRPPWSGSGCQNRHDVVGSSRSARATSRLPGR